MRRDFSAFEKRIKNEVLNHRVITDNKYLHWFEKGEFDVTHMKDFLIQFSVFSNLFLIAQIKKMINADSIESMRASKEILVNELGVIFKPTNESDSKKRVENLVYDTASDPELVSPEGTVEGSIFRFSAAHFEWLVRIAKDVGLGFHDIGKRKHGTQETIHFCDELSRLYGSDDYETSQSASFAVENWAYLSNFWKQLTNGLKAFQEKNQMKFPLGFFTYHDRLEQQHAEHTQEELKEYYEENPNLDEDHYIKVGNEMLDGVQVFWDGLEGMAK